MPDERFRREIGGITRLGVSSCGEAPFVADRHENAGMQPPSGGWGSPCPVCGRPSGDTGSGPCPQCGLPAVGHAALVVARIGATLTDLARDRDALLASLRAAAPGIARPPMPAPPAPTPWPPAPTPWPPAPTPWTPPAAPAVTPPP